MSRHHSSPLADDLEAARDEGTEDVVAHATRRHPVVRATRLPASGRELAFRQAMHDLFGDRDIDGEGPC